MFKTKFHIFLFTKKENLVRGQESDIKVGGILERSTAHFNFMDVVRRLMFRWLICKSCSRRQAFCIISQAVHNATSATPQAWKSPTSHTRDSSNTNMRQSGSMTAELSMFSVSTRKPCNAILPEIKIFWRTDCMGHFQCPKRNTSPRKAPWDKFHVPIYLFQPKWPVWW